MTITIFHNPACGTSRNVLALIRNSGEEPEVIEYLKTPPTRDVLADLIRRMGDMLLLVQVERHVGLVRYSPGRIEFEPRGDAPRDLAQKLADRLRGWTGGQRWAVTVTNEGGAPTIAEQQAAEQREREERALQLPIVQQVLATFPGAKLRDVRRVAPEVEAVEAEGAANPHELTQGPVAEVEEWDPFEDEE